MCFLSPGASELCWVVCGVSPVAEQAGSPMAHGPPATSLAPSSSSLFPGTCSVSQALSLQRGLPGWLASLVAQPMGTSKGGGRRGQGVSLSLLLWVTFLAVATTQSCPWLPRWSCSCWWPAAPGPRITTCSLRVPPAPGQKCLSVVAVPGLPIWPFSSFITIVADPVCFSLLNPNSPVWAVLLTETRSTGWAFESRPFPKAHALSWSFLMPGPAEGGGLCL